jgi:hypothetical protein
MKNFIYLIALLLVSINPAYATYPAEIVFYISTPSPSYSGADEACDGYISVKNATAPTTHRWSKSVAESSATTCQAYYRRLSDNSVFDSFNQTIIKAGKCGSVYTPNNFFCAGDPPPPPCSAGDAGFSGIPQPSGSSASTLSPSSINQIGCKNGCLTKLDASRGNWYGGSDGSSYNVYGYSNYTGATCSVSSSNPAPSNAPPAPNIKDCADSGKSYGTVNGVAVCVSAGSTGSAPVIQNKTGASSTSTPAPTPENPNPTPVTTKEPDSMVISVPPSATSDGTVKTGQTNADGSQTSTSESKESFCSKNPASEQCQAKSLCEKNPDAPSCKDICEKKPDLLICKQTDIDQLCADKPDRWECKKAEDLIGKKDDLPNEELGKKSVNVGDNFNFNPVNIQSNATCPPPLTTSIAGATITVSFDWLCAYASAFRPLVMALAFFFAYGIIAAAIRADAQPYQRGLF